jgi:hypothetical protein
MLQIPVVLVLAGAGILTGIELVKIDGKSRLGWALALVLCVLLISRLT